MRVAKRSPKLLAALLGLGSIAVFAGVLSDMKLHSNQFMDSIQIEVPTKTGRLESKRFVASSNNENLPAVQYIPYNTENRKLIDGQWEITRVLDVEGNAYYDKFGNYEDRNKYLPVDFNLVRTSTVMIDNDQAQVFKISLMPNKKTIVLFKIMNKGYEILEARKVSEVKTVTPVKEKETVESTQEEKITGLRLESDVDLVLERALHPSKTSKLLKGDSIRGDVSLVGGNIQSLAVSLYINENGEPIDVNVPFAEINNGGMFDAMVGSETVHGIITNNGEQAYRIRFATGPLQGAMLNFVTREKLQQIQDEEYQQSRQTQEAETFREDYYSENTEVYDQEEVSQEQMSYENARVVADDSYANNSYEKDLSQEQRDQIVEESGYRF